MGAAETRANGGGGASHGAEKPTEAAFRALLRTTGLLRRAQQPYFARFGISGSQWGVLRTLHRAEAEGVMSLRLTDIGDRLLIRPPSVTGVMDRLERQGLVSRETSATDQRAREVSLTAAGRHLIARVMEGHTQRIKTVLQALTLAEQKDLSQLLDRLGAHMEAMVEQEASGAGPGSGSGSGGAGAGDHDSDE